MQVYMKTPKIFIALHKGDMSEWKRCVVPSIGKEKYFKLNYIPILKLQWIIIRIQNGSNAEEQVNSKGNFEVGENFFYQI